MSKGFEYDTYDGTELCCNCGKEFDFVVVPAKSVLVTCTHCGTVQHPCSLCDPPHVDCSGNKCKENIIESLKEAQI